MVNYTMKNRTKLNAIALAVTIAATLGFVGSANAQQAVDANTFDLQAAIKLAIQTSSALTQATRDLDRDHAAIDEAHAGERPQVNATATYVHLDSPISIVFARQTIPVQPENTQTLQSTLALPIDISGAVKDQVSAEKLQLQADTAIRQRIYNGLVVSANTAYFNVLRAQHQVDVAKATVTNAQTQTDLASSQYSKGIGQKIDLYRAQTQLAQAQQGQSNAENSLNLADSNFNDVVGRPLGSPVTVQDIPGVTEGLTLPAATAPVTVTPAPLPASFIPPHADVDAINLATSIATADASRPELAADKVAVQAAGEQVKLARTGLYPTLTLTAEGNYYPTTDFGNPRHSLGIYLATLSLPLYDGGVTHDKVREAKDATKNATDALTNDQTTVELQVRQAYLNLRNAADEIDEANSALAEATAARQLAQVRYTGGVGLYLEVTDSEQALESAESSQINAVYDYLIARANFESAIGSPNLNPSM